MKVLILTEAGKDIGFGHLTRCIALCQAIEEGNNLELIINANEDILDFVKGKKYRVLNWLKDKKKVEELVRNSEFVIIDSYLAEKSLYYKISDIMNGKVLMIDDYGRLEYPKGIIVNPSIYGDKLEYSQKDGVTYLLGKDYIILRKEFCTVPGKNINQELNNVLITFGGMSHFKLGSRIADCFRSKFDFNFYILDVEKQKLGAKQMLNLMLKSDLAISGGGQTTYELARVGVPTVGICFADNQRMNLEGWQDEGFIEYVGWYNENNLLKKVGDAVNKLKFYEERIRCSQVGRNCVDGRGALKVTMTVLETLAKSS